MRTSPTPVPKTVARLATTTAMIVIAAATPIALVAAAGPEPTAPPPAASHPSTAVIRVDDPTIVAIFDIANGADIETGRLAADRATSKEVRDFGAMLVRDHEAVRQMGRDLAKKLGVTPTPPVDRQMEKDHIAAVARLKALKGNAFDVAFLRHEADFHKAVIDAIKTTLLPAIQNAELRALVVKVAPAFEAHMLAAQQMEKRLTGRSGTGDMQHRDH